MADFSQINQEIDDNIKQNGVNAITGAKMNTVLKDMVSAVNNEKQDIISDIDEIRSGAEAGATAFQKPSEGIPSTDMDEQVQAALDNAENAVLYSEQSVGITDQQRNTALANVSNQTANSTTGKMGYKVLDPTKTFAEQVTAENTIYEIKDVFDLNNADSDSPFVMPYNTTLYFNGGKLINGKLGGNSTKIEAEPVQIFDNMSFVYYWDKCFEAYPEWFGAISRDSTVDSKDAIQLCLDSFLITKLSGIYYISGGLTIPNGHSLVGINTHNTALYATQSMISVITHKETIASGITIKNIMITRTDENVNVTNCILLNRATNTNIIGVTAGNSVNAFALNSFYGGGIKHCTASNCDNGFYLGINGGNSTSIAYINNYALNCVNGHIFRNCSYITAISPSADNTDVAYECINSKIILDSAGSESGTTFFKLVTRNDIDVLNYNANVVIINNAVCISNKPNTNGLIYISTGTRGAYDRNRVCFNGFYAHFETNSDTDKILYYSGDTVVEFNNVIVDNKEIMNNGNTHISVDGVRRIVNNIAYIGDKQIGTQIFYNSSTKKIPCWWNGSAWVDANGYSYATNRSGTTTQRPTLTSTDIGYQYFDTTLGKYICWNGTAWVNLDGTALS